MKKFLKLLFLFFCPLFLIIAFFEYLLFSYGETSSIEHVLEIQAKSEREIEFMRGIISQDYNSYKLAGIKYSKPDILSIGSSRVMKFRDIHFKEDLSFYNAGGLIQCVKDLEYFEKLISEKLIEKPNFLIVGLDPWWYKLDVSSKKTWLTKTKAIDHSRDVSSHIKSYFRIISKWKVFSKNIIEPENFGALAKISGGGFRKDGSKTVNTEVIDDFLINQKYVDRETPPVNERIKKGLTKRFSISKPDTSAFDLTLKILKKLENQNIQLLIYLPPFSNESYNLLQITKPHQSWWSFVRDQMYIKLKNDFKFVVPIQRPKNFNLEDIYFLDGFHPSEVFVGIQLAGLFDKNPELKDIISIDKIKNCTKNAYTPLCYEKPE